MFFCCPESQSVVLPVNQKPLKYFIMRNYEYNYINYIREHVTPDAHKKQYGSYVSFDDRPISPGCMACKTGGWLCAFIGTRCNATCPHCPNHTVNKGADIATATGMNGSVDIDDILLKLEQPYYKGVGISGGEPLMYIDELVEWVTKIKAKFPHLYVWNYTNGLLASETNLRRLAEAGLDEIRFDLAAYDYAPEILNNMKNAVGIIPSVGIEIPVLLEQYGDLIKAIDFADSVGVKYINLHDLYVNDLIDKNGLGGYMKFYDQVSGIQRDIFSSSVMIYKALRHIKDNNLQIVPNDCTLINMQMQTFSFGYQSYIDGGNPPIEFDAYMDKILNDCSEDILLLDKEFCNPL